MSKTLPTLTTTTTLGQNDIMLVRQSGDTVDKAISAANLRLQLQLNNRSIFATDYGAKFDGKMLTDVTLTNGSPNVSSASYTFVTDDIGKCVVIKDADTSTTYRFRGTITGISSGSAVLSSNLNGNVSNAKMYFGTDDTVAIQAAVDAANPTDVYGTGTWTYQNSGVVVFPAGMSMITKEIKMRPCVSLKGQGMFQTWLKWASTNTMAVTDYYAIFHFGGASGSTRIYRDHIVSDMHLDVSAAFTTVYNYHSKCIEAIYIQRSSFLNVFFDSSPGTSLGMDFVAGVLVHGCVFYKSGRLWVAGAGGGSGIDFQTDNSVFYMDGFNVAAGRQTVIISNNRFYDCAVSACRFSNNTVGLVNQVPIITGNYIVSSITSNGKGIEDSGGTGAVIVGNTVVQTGTQSSEGTGGGEGQHYWAGITTLGGQYGVIANNTIIGGWAHGIAVRRFTYPASTLSPNNYLITGNSVKGSASHGVHIVTASGYTFKDITISNNRISECAAAGIALTNNGTSGTVSRINIMNNVVYSNGATTATDTEKSGILIENAVANLNISNNIVYDNGAATQKYAVTVNNVAITEGFITGNDFSGNTTSVLNIVSSGSIAGEVTNNKGYHPGSASVSPGASPYTYTSGFTPEVVYVSGGTVSGITKNSVSMPTSGQFPLNPNESIIITYSVAPTIVADKK